MNALKAWYAGLQERERRMVLAGGVAVAVLILTGGILMPLHSSVAAARDRLETQRDDLAWMQQNAAEIQAAAGSFSGPLNESPVVLVDRTGRESGLSQSLRGTQPSGNAGVRVELEAAPFDTLVSWLANLEQRHGVSIDSITVDRTARPGLVNASVTLSQAKH
jgi:general secretion pathway protein M